MAYANKYYDPDKAHAYYMKNRELKGYEDRYGGWRGNGTSGASISGSLGPNTQHSSGTVEVTPSNGRQKSSGTVQVTPSNSISGSFGSRRQSSSGTVEVTEEPSNRTNTSGTVEVTEDKSYLRDSNAFNDHVTKIKEQYDKERDDAIKKANTDADNAMLREVEHLAEQLKKRQAAGEIIDKKQFKSQIVSALGRTKKIKIKAQQKYTAEHKEKYKSTIEKLKQELKDYNNQLRVQSTSKRKSTADTGMVEVHEETNNKLKKSTGTVTVTRGF